MSIGNKVCLTPELVNSLEIPHQGERWIADSHLPHFGLRLWAGKNGGGKAFAIRLRDKSGRLIRESFNPGRDWDLYYWMTPWRKSFGDFLEPARLWAFDRIAFHKGRPNSEERRKNQLVRREIRIMGEKLGTVLESRLKRLRKTSRRPAYLDQNEDLIRQWIPQTLLDKKLSDLSHRELAEAMTDHRIPFGSARRLRAFVNGSLLQLSRQYGPLGLEVKAIQGHCREILDARTEPPYPKIKTINKDEFGRYFEVLENEPNWRQALAIRLYFATGARMQQVLKARWSDFVGNSWFPFTPDERKCWFEAEERLQDEARNVLTKIANRHLQEQLQSCFLFPSAKFGPSMPIRTVQRMWHRTCSPFGWQDLPLSHMAWRHRPRTSPSYYLDFSRTNLGSLKVDSGFPSVSKVGKRRAENNVFADTYLVGHIPL